MAAGPLQCADGGWVGQLDLPGLELGGVVVASDAEGSAEDVATAHVEPAKGRQGKDS